MQGNYSKITGDRLAKLMAVSSGTYMSANIESSYSFWNPVDIMDKNNTFKEFPHGVKRVIHGDFISGDIWMGGWDTMYLYIGQLFDGIDVAMVIGGDTTSYGYFEQGVINSDDEGQIFFDKKLYSIVSSISGDNLAELMGVNSDTYDSANIKTSYPFKNPSTILTQDYIFERFPKGVQKVTNGDFKSGDIWMGGWDTIYLYIGKIPQGNDVAMVIGGDTTSYGHFEQGVINPDDEGNFYSGNDGMLFFDKKLFS